MSFQVLLTSCAPLLASLQMLLTPFAMRLLRFEVLLVSFELLRTSFRTLLVPFRGLLVPLEVTLASFGMLLRSFRMRSQALLQTSLQSVPWSRHVASQNAFGGADCAAVAFLADRALSSRPSTCPCFFYTDLWAEFYVWVCRMLRQPACSLPVESLKLLLFPRSV
jgi:hypothetical protein